ncbi:hypothetical protein EDF59_14820 [Novosphingobium sp. ST904]|nr:hypothetical protein EDF59_14820 [Novosphingobium sp. ST904]
MAFGSPAASAFRRRVEDETRFLETCEGGDQGSPDRRSIWLLGIEPGWSLADQALDEVGLRKKAEALHHYGIEMQLQWPYNRNAFKFLAALKGRPVETYREFARTVRPFERGSLGYFKANLFPEPFNNTGEWTNEAVEKTGFVSKAAYQTWLREARFPVFRAWIEKCYPKLVIGTGLTHLADFLAITGTVESPSPRFFEVNGHPKRLHIATSGIVPVAILPHLSGGSHSLNSYEATRIAADMVRTVLLD